MRDEDRRANDREFAGIVRNYLKYEGGKLTLEEWTDEAVRRIMHLRDMDGSNEFYLLAHAHICLIGGRTDEAKMLLESYNYNRFAIGKDVELSSYYLYLTTFLSSDSIGQRKVARGAVKNIYSRIRTAGRSSACSWMSIRSTRSTVSGSMLWKNSFMKRNPTASGSIFRRSGATGIRALL